MTTETNNTALTDDDHRPAGAGPVQHTVRPGAEASPLVERLRYRAFNGISPMHQYARDDMIEAAAEIDRLQALLARQQASYEREIALDVAAERERMCVAIKAADDKAADADYMLDSDDCISVIRGTWDLKA